MSEGTERTEVSTYVPKAQKAEWKAHAERLEMSQSEFVRSMVQAGRRGFELGEAEGRSPPTDPGGDGLEERVLTTLESTPEALSWEALLEAVSGDFEDRLDEALDSLQREDRIRYSGRHGGYVVTDGR
ncbi:DUF5805 domain-containing protein [Halobium salinum]|uniref:DUF5805 domain-containing protein n=1 Tax=Halobium salinum TaxID=1364940 RepID=A0ABD5PEH3_9EURY|nr:DUF5805 domain-containing protein [Halobium salinum]